MVYPAAAGYRYDRSRRSGSDVPDPRFLLSDDLGGWIECGRFEDADEAISLRDELQIGDPDHRYKIMTTD